MKNNSKQRREQRVGRAWEAMCAGYMDVYQEWLACAKQVRQEDPSLRIQIVLEGREEYLRHDLERRLRAIRALEIKHNLEPFEAQIPRGFHEK